MGTGPKPIRLGLQEKMNLDNVLTSTDLIHVWAALAVYMKG